MPSGIRQRRRRTVFSTNSMVRRMIVTDRSRKPEATPMKSRLTAILLAAVLAVGSACAHAAPPRSAPTPQASHPASLEQAVKQVQQQTRGHILAADTVSRGRTNVYRIKVLTPKGRVQVMQLHSNSPSQGRSGKIRSHQGGH
jgi:hypothetical protein